MYNISTAVNPYRLPFSINPAVLHIVKIFSACNQIIQIGLQCRKVRGIDKMPVIFNDIVKSDFPESENVPLREGKYNNSHL